MQCVCRDAQQPHQDQVFAAFFCSFQPSIPIAIFDLRLIRHLIETRASTMSLMIAEKGPVADFLRARLPTVRVLSVH